MMKGSREARIGGLNRQAALTGLLCTFLVHCMHAVDGGSAWSAVSAPVRQGEGTSLLLGGGARIVAKASPLLDRAERALDAASMSFHQVPAVLEQKRQDGLRWLTEAREALKRGGRIKGRRDRLTLEGSLPDRSPVGYTPSSLITSGPISTSVSESNLELSRQVLELMTKQDWQSVGEKDGITVQRRGGEDVDVRGFPPGVGPRVTSDVSKFICVRAVGEIDASIDKVYGLFLSNDYVCEYNDLCQEVRDVGFLDPSTKVSWASSKRIGPFAPRDFVTRCHYRRLWDGSLLLSTMSERTLECNSFRAEGVSAGQYCRMDIILAGYLFQSIDSGTRTRVEMVSMANPGGVLDSTVGAMISSMLCSTGPLKFVAALRKLSTRPVEN